MGNRVELSKAQEKSAGQAADYFREYMKMVSLPRIIIPEGKEPFVNAHWLGVTVGIQWATLMRWRYMHGWVRMLQTNPKEWRVELTDAGRAVIGGKR